MADRSHTPSRRSYSASGSSRDRVRRWESYNAEALIAVECAVPSSAPLRATEINLAMPRLHLATVSGSPHRVVRTAEIIERFPADAVAVYVSLGPDALFVNGGHRQVVRRGDVLVCDPDRPFEREFGYGVSEFALKVPRSELHATVGADVLDRPRLLSAGRDPAAHALTRSVASATRTSGAVSIDELATLELVGLLVTGTAAPPEVRHRVAARSYIEEHLTDRGLSAGAIATAVGISERQLSRIFGAAGSSVPQYILARRLELAHSLLTAGRSPSTSAVAHATGFASLPHFSRAFQDRFGVTAGSVRRAGAA